MDKALNTLQYIIDKYQLKIGRHSPVEIPNMLRENLAELFNELGFTVGAEIGVLYGAFSKQLCEKNPNLKLYCVDPYLAYYGFLPGPPDQDAQDKIFESCKETMAPYNHEFIRKTSIEAAKDFKDESLDFVYIDGNHDLLNVVLDITLWSPKVRKGGIIGGHDYTPCKNSSGQIIHVQEGVQAFAKAYEIKPWFIFGTFKPGNGSFMWVKK